MTALPYPTTAISLSLLAIAIGILALLLYTHYHRDTPESPMTRDPITTDDVWHEVYCDTCGQLGGSVAGAHAETIKHEHETRYDHAVKITPRHR